jgi:hypothetical protein
VCLMGTAEGEREPLCLSSRFECTRNKKNRTKQTEAPRPRASQKKAQPFVNFGSFLSSGIEIIFSEANGSSLA